MVDPFEFLSNYAEWHYLWMGIFIGLSAGFALGAWARHRLRNFVHRDVVESLVRLGVSTPDALPPREFDGARASAQGLVHEPQRDQH